MSIDASEFRDTTKTSRKGRKPTGDKVMTPAERKRKQRQRQREANRELPSWLRLRHSLWQVIQQQFIFADVDELSNTLRALGEALAMANAYRSDPNFADWYDSLLIYRDPDNFPKELDYITEFFPELKAYQFDANHYANRKGTKLFDILRDIIEGHENSDEVQP